MLCKGKHLYIVAVQHSNDERYDVLLALADLHLKADTVDTVTGHGAATSVSHLFLVTVTKLLNAIPLLYIHNYNYYII